MIVVGYEAAHLELQFVIGHHPTLSAVSEPVTALSEVTLTVRPMDSTWETREMPVLAAVVQLCDEDDWGQAEPEQIAERTGLAVADVKKAVYRLLGEQPPFFQVADATTFGGRDFASVHSPTGHAQRTVGAWPTPENLSERIIDALAEAAESEEDPEKKSRLSHKGDVGKGTLAGVLVRVLTQGF